MPNREPAALLLPRKPTEPEAPSLKTQKTRHPSMVSLSSTMAWPAAIALNLWFILPTTSSRPTSELSLDSFESHRNFFFSQIFRFEFLGLFRTIEFENKSSFLFEVSHQPRLAPTLAKPSDMAPSTKIGVLLRRHTPSFGWYVFCLRLEPIRALLHSVQHQPFGLWCFCSKSYNLGSQIAAHYHGPHKKKISFGSAWSSPTFSMWACSPTRDPPQPNLWSYVSRTNFFSHPWLHIFLGSQILFRLIILGPMGFILFLPPTLIWSEVQIY